MKLKRTADADIPKKTLGAMFPRFSSTVTRKKSELRAVY